MQKAGIAAITHGEPVIAHTVARFRAVRDVLIARLRGIERVEVATPPGTMNAFFRVRGAEDGLAFCKRLVAKAGLGLAPGNAFGPEGEGCVRWCFAASAARLAQGVERLDQFLARVNG